MEDLMMPKTGSLLFAVLLLASSLAAQTDKAAVQDVPEEGLYRAAISSFSLVPFDSLLEPERSSSMV